MSDYDQARALDRELNATRDPQRMRELISRRRLVRAALSFDEAMRQYERDNPIPPAATRESFPYRLG
jgi:hypothetical protein